MTALCPWCSAPRGDGPDCPKCGANYAKAEAIKAHGRAEPAAVIDAPQVGAEPANGEPLIYAGESRDDWNAVDDPELEWKFCAAAIPVALCVAMMFQATGFGAGLQRIFLTMPVHEFGHAITAWFCGYTAIPTLWKTLVPETRGIIAPLALAATLTYGMFHAWRIGHKPLLYIAGGLLLLQGVGTFVISTRTAQLLITFGGDGMGLILATLLMGSFFFGKNTQLYKGSLRWGFVVIGAAAFVDIYATWWRSRTNETAIPYGTTGGMATDAMKLVDDYGWTLQTLVNRYVVLGLCCLIALAVVYARGVRRAKTQWEARQLDQKQSEWEHRKVRAG